MAKAFRSTVESEMEFNNYTTRSCPTCGQVFFARGSAWVCIGFCSDECCRVARNKRRREKRAKAREYRSVERGTCARCGLTLYFQVRATRRYCSDQCRQLAYRERQKTMKGATATATP
jgi:hypothetical protein